VESTPPPPAIPALVEPVIPSFPVLPETTPPPSAKEETPPPPPPTQTEDVAIDLA